MARAPWLGQGPVPAQTGRWQKVFQAVATDAKGVETEVHGVIYYWEENKRNVVCAA